MRYNFDEYIERRNTNSMKWDMGKYKNSHLTPMWVADMDFKSPVEVIDALRERVEHGIFGYGITPEELNDLVIERLDKLYSWKIKSQWIVWLPGLVTGFNVAARAVGNQGNDIATAVPVYYPFLHAPENNFQTITKSVMLEENNRWVLDYDAISSTIKPNTSMFLLCNPHNPGGTVFTREELLKLSEICLKNNTVICSDEIHCDLILDKHCKHIPIASLSHEIAENSITLMAPSKTYNIAGLGCSFAIIPNENLRKKYEKAMNGLIPLVNTLGYTAALAAYKHGDEWLKQLLDYLRGNLEIIHEYVNKMKGFRMLKNEATFLAWIDCRNSDIENPADFFEKAGVGLSDGSGFDGKGFIRLNFGCSRAILKSSLDKMLKAVNSLN